MPKSLHKVQKRIAKKKKGKAGALHEKSRDSKKLQQALAREEKLSGFATNRARANQSYLQRVAFFQYAVRDKDIALSEEEIHSTIQNFLRRDDVELATLKAERRPGRPSSTREDQLKHKQLAEEQEYSSGFWMPDLKDVMNVAKLRDWNGDWTALGIVKFVRMASNGKETESSFPPRGHA